MKLARGPRPRAVVAFVVYLLLNALWAYVQRLGRLDQPLALHGYVFNPATDHDLMIVTFSAQLTIVLIPLAMIWFLASNLARWLVTITSLVTAPLLVMQLWPLFQQGVINVANLLLALVPQFAFLLLFTRDGARWFARERNLEAAFD